MSMKNTKMFSKRTVMFAVLILALSAAVFLNWKYSDGGFIISGALSGDETSAEVETKYLGDAQYVNATTASDYFTLSRQQRDKTREDSIASLNEIINNVKSTDDAKTLAAERLTSITRAAENEQAIETVIIAKGFEKCVVIISDESVNVVVKSDEDGLLPSETVQIQDAVTSVAATNLENIKIIQIK